MEENKLDDKLKKEIENLVFERIRAYNKNESFTERRITDTLHGDAFSVVNKKFVSGNGTFTNRPKAVVGQRYFATDLATNGKPTWYNGTNWVDSVGSILGAGI